MYTLKVIAHSKSGKSVLVSVSKKAGIFMSTVATGNLKITDGEQLPEVGSIHELPGINKVSVTTSVAEENNAEFNWIVLES